MVRTFPNRNTVEELTEEIDEAGFVRQYNFFYLPIRMLCLCLALANLLLCVAPPSSSIVTVAVSIPHCVVKSDRLSLDDDRLREDCYYEELDEEIMKENSGIDTSTMKMKQRYQGQDRLSDKSQWQLPSNRVSDEKAPTGRDRASYQAREPIEGDKERLAVRHGDMPST